MKTFSIHEETKKRLGHYTDLYINNIEKAFDILDPQGNGYIAEGIYNDFDLLSKVAELTYSVVLADEDNQPVFQYVGC